MALRMFIGAMVVKCSKLSGTSPRIHRSSSSSTRRMKPLLNHPGPGHTRVCAGYLSYQMFNNLYIYDPWPVNTGREYWETWGLIQPDGAYIYVK